MTSTLQYALNGTPLEFECLLKAYLGNCTGLPRPSLQGGTDSLFLMSRAPT
jgi:hypothetical protein